MQKTSKVCERLILLPIYLISICFDSFQYTWIVFDIDERGMCTGWYRCVQVQDKSWDAIIRILILTVLLQTGDVQLVTWCCVKPKLALARQCGGVNFQSQKILSNWIRSIGTAHNCKFFFDCTSLNTAHCAKKAIWGNFWCPWSSFPSIRSWTDTTKAHIFAKS